MRALELSTISACLFLAAAVHAEIPAKNYPPGTGSRFRLHYGDVTADVMLYVTQSSSSRLDFEYYLTAPSVLVPVQLWQQFSLVPKPEGGLRVADGYILSPDLKAPERLDATQLQGLDGVPLSGFLFARREELERLRVGEETVTVEAGTVKATHYHQPTGKDTLDYWVSEEARPFGLVKLEATSPDPTRTYTLTLGAKLKNVGRKIDPATAVPLDEKGRELMSLPGKHSPFLMAP